MKLTDTHCHLYFDSYRGDLEAVLDRSREAGLIRILIPGIDLDSCRQVLELIERYDILYGAVGVHPNSGTGWNEGTRDVLTEMAHHPKVVAIGEIGLDYYRDRTPREKQREILLQQLDIAGDCGLPAVLHVRNSSEQDRSCMIDLLDILDDWAQDVGDAFRARGSHPGVVHSFSGNLQESSRAREAGFLLGITGPVTYKNASGLRDVVRETDLSDLVVETDGPFLSPQERRGKRNEPAHVRYIIDKISEVTGRPAMQVAEQTTANAARLFLWE